jgi:DNA-binding LacI/PurR family transcriptional regulator
MLGSKRVDGLIVTSSRVGAIYQEHLDRLGVPIVLINSHREQRGPYTFSVNVNNRHGAYTATKYLTGLGHRRIAYVTGAADHSDDLERQAGYRQALAEAGIAHDSALVVPGTGRAGGGERAFPILASQSPPPSAVFCYNDMTAIGLLQAVRHMGLKVPEDLSVVGFDDIPLASYMSPPLTTIAQPVPKMGRIAVEMVLRLATNQEVDRSQVTNVVVQGELIVRHSSGTIAHTA